MSSSSSISSLDMADNELVDKEITDFFKSLDLNVVFEDGCFMNTCCSMFEHVKSELLHIKPGNADFKLAVKNSYEFEQNIMMKPATATQLLQSNNSISNVYCAFAHPTINSSIGTTNTTDSFRRQRAVFINGIYSKTYSGALIKNINYAKLQNWVNVYHNYQFEQPVNKMICGFVLHLLYIRLVPHDCFNLAISRYLFLENKFQIDNSDMSFVPVSILLNDNVVPVLDMMNTVYEYIFDTIKDPCKATESEYYNLTLPSRILKGIYYIIYVSRLHFISCKYNSKLRRQLNKNIDYMYIFCTGHGCFPIYSTTTVRISEERGLANIKFVNWVNGTLFDYTRHKKFLSLFNVK